VCCNKAKRAGLAFLSICKRRVRCAELAGSELAERGNHILFSQSCQREWKATSRDGCASIIVRGHQQFVSTAPVHHSHRSMCFKEIRGFAQSGAQSCIRGCKKVNQAENHDPTRKPLYSNGLVLKRGYITNSMQPVSGRNGNSSWEP
jgi:hypothetical protein